MLFTTVMLLFSCDENKTYHNGAVLIFQKSLTIAIDQYSSQQFRNSDFIALNDSIIEFSIHNVFQNSIDVHLINDNSNEVKFLRRVYLENATKENLGSIMAFCYLNQNQYYILPRRQPYAGFIYDKHGILSKKINLSNWLEKNNSGPPIPSLFINNRIYEINKLLYYTFYVNGREPDLNTKFIGYTVNPVNGECEYIAVKNNHPAIKYVQMYDGKSIWYDYGLEYVYRLNLQNHSTDSLKVVSQFHTDPATSSELSKLNTIAEITDEQLSYTRYKGIIYDPYQNLNYRVVIPKIDIENYKESERMDLAVQPEYFTLIVFNEKGKILGEHIFPKHTYTPHNYFITPSGIFFARNHNRLEDLAEDQIVFDGFRFIN